MAHNDSPDQEFDPEMERILRDYFAAESPGLRAPGDTWRRLEGRMSQPAPSFLSRLLRGLWPMRNGRPALAIAGMAVAAIALSAVVWLVADGGNGDYRDDGTMGGVVVRDPAATAAPDQDRDGADGARGPAGPAGAAGAAGPAGADPARAAPTSAPAPRSAPTTMPYPTATPAPAVAMGEGEAVEVTRVVEVESPAATAAPMPTAMPAMAAGADAAGPVGAAGPRGPRPTTAASGPTPAADAMQQAPPDTTFRDYQRQPFVAAADDNVSTFSLDADRTSYHLALGWARAGYPVPPDAVRAEEWVNAFNYGYPAPAGAGEFGISAGLYPHPLDAGKRLARIAFQAPQLADDRPLNVTLVLDASGSMADGNRVDIARAAAETLRQSLRPDDRIAVVHFTDHVIDRHTVTHSPPGDGRVQESIRRLAPHGSTNVQAGLNLGVELADQARRQRPDAYNYVVLMSDGVANVDATNPFAILETAYDADAGNPLRLIAIGVGINNYNDALLEQLAQHGNGWYRYLNDPAQARATFARDNWLALSTPFADQTRAQVTWNADTVERWRIVGYENRVTPDATFTEDRKKFAEIFSGAATTVFYELELTDAAAGQSAVELGNVAVRWVDPAGGESRLQTAALTGRPGAGFAGADGNMAHFGAIVALAADRYAGLPPGNGGGYDYAPAHRDLSALLQRLGQLNGGVTALDAYHDFRFLLEHLVGGLAATLPPATPSGYSR